MACDVEIPLSVTVVRETAEPPSFLGVGSMSEAFTDPPVMVHEPASPALP
jgi:hypothetical protein